MNDFLAVFAMCIFFCSSYLVYDLFSSGFNVYVLLAAIIGYVIVHIMWPKKRDNDSAWYDMLELIFDLPYQAMALCLRTISFRGSKSDLDIDIDL